MRTASLATAGLLLWLSGVGLAQEDPALPLDDSTGEPTADTADYGEVTDSDITPGSEVLSADVGAGPLAFGVVYSSGAKQSGTPNWSSTYNSTYGRYEITISGENYYYLDYATNITPAGDVRFCRSSSVSGKLLVYCYDGGGNAQLARFGFTTFKTP
jgi:hypothetical protein